METISQQLDTIIGQHRAKLAKINETEAAANDIEIIIRMYRSVSQIDAGKLRRSGKLEKLEGTLGDIASWLETHFGLEERLLPKVGKEIGKPEILDSIALLLFQHTEIKERIAQSLRQLGELKSGDLATHRWTDSAETMRIHLVHTLELLRLHAKHEELLFRTLRTKLATKSLPPKRGHLPAPSVSP